MARPAKPRNISFDLPADLYEHAAARATAQGFESVDLYLRARLVDALERQANRPPATDPKAGVEPRPKQREKAR